VGFGIRDGATAKAVAKVADGVVVGSALVSALAETGVEGMAQLTQEIRQSLDAH